MRVDTDGVLGKHNVKNTLSVCAKRLARGDSDSIIATDRAGCQTSTSYWLVWVYTSRRGVTMPCPIQMDKLSEPPWRIPHSLIPTIFRSRSRSRSERYNRLRTTILLSPTGFVSVKFLICRRIASKRIHRKAGTPSLP